MNLNFLKGMLIILVVIDHNEYSRALFPAFLLGMSFHVVGFMTIPFLKAPASLGTRGFADYAFRLYYPFLLVTCGMWAVVSVLGNAPIAQRLGVLGIALYSANADILKQATQMGLLWFLPSFICVVILRSLIEQRGQIGRAVAAVLLLGAHLVIGTYARAIQDYLPLGLLPAVYIVPLAYAGAVLHQKVFEPMRVPLASLLSVAIFAGVKLLQMDMDLDNEVGFSFVADFHDPLALLVNDLEAVFGTVMLFQLSRWKLDGVVAQCGKYSMQIYLFHAFVAFAIYQVLLRYVPQDTPGALFALSVLATVLLMLLLAWGVMRTPLLKRLVFPRSPAELFGKP